MEFEHPKWNYLCMQTTKENSAGAQKQELKQWSVLQDYTESFSYLVK